MMETSSFHISMFESTSGVSVHFQRTSINFSIPT